MHYAELIKAAVDGAIIQQKPIADKSTLGWSDLSQQYAISTLMYYASPSALYEFRIKPIPKPDVVRYKWVGGDKSTNEEQRLNIFADAKACGGTVIKYSRCGESGRETVELIKPEDEQCV